MFFLRRVHESQDDPTGRKKSPRHEDEPHPQLPDEFKMKVKTNAKSGYYLKFAVAPMIRK
jgi:hypothetical protein